MWIRLLFVLVLLLSHAGIECLAQEGKFYIRGQILNSNDGLPVEGVKIIVNKPLAVTLSGKEGRYALITVNRPGLLIDFQRIGFKNQRITLTPELLKNRKDDTLYLNVRMEEESITLPVFEFISGPDTVIGSYRFFIEDYLFADSGRFLLLTFERNLKSAHIVLADTDDHILSSVDVPVEARELYKDYLGNCNVLSTDTAFRIKILPNNRLILMALPYSDFAARMFPCIDTIGRNILFSNYDSNYPSFSYFLYNTNDTSVQRIRDIVNQRLLDQYNYELDFLLPKDRLYARKMEIWTGIDKRIIAATMTGFSQSSQYTPLYAPLFFTHDTIFIFDHYRDQLYRYRKNLSQIDSLKINYHHPKNWKEWDHQLLRDESTGEVYARFEKNGFYSLKKINLNTGEITGTFKVTYPYVKHIRIRNGYVYYIYREYESVQKKMLYKEPIQLVGS